MTLEKDIPARHGKKAKYGDCYPTTQVARRLGKIPDLAYSCVLGGRYAVGLWRPKFYISPNVGAVKDSMGWVSNLSSDIVMYSEEASTLQYEAQKRIKSKKVSRRAAERTVGVSEGYSLME